MSFELEAHAPFTFTDSVSLTASVCFRGLPSLKCSLFLGVPFSLIDPFSFGTPFFVVASFGFDTSFSKWATTCAGESVALACSCFGFRGDKSGLDRERVFDLFGRKGMGVDGRDERNFGQLACDHEEYIKEYSQRMLQTRGQREKPEPHLREYRRPTLSVKKMKLCIR
jgi:hypothetical protein